MELGMLQNTEEVRAARGRDIAVWQAEQGWASRWLIDSARIQDQLRQWSVFRAGCVPGGRSRGSRSQPQKEVGRHRCPQPHTEAREEPSVQEEQAECSLLLRTSRQHSSAPGLCRKPSPVLPESPQALSCVVATTAVLGSIPEELTKLTT